MPEPLPLIGIFKSEDLQGRINNKIGSKNIAWLQTFIKDNVQQFIDGYKGGKPQKVPVDEKNKLIQHIIVFSFLSYGASARKSEGRYKIGISKNTLS